MSVVVTGGAGFLGSHLCEELLCLGHEVVCVDDLSTGRWQNLAGLVATPGFSFVRQDACDPLDLRGPVEAVFHLASPASPADYHRHPLETLAVGSRGTEQALLLARRHGARFVLASTSEVYGDPEVHPQPETYWGHVNPIGPRSVYDEAKRFAEALTMAHRRSLGTDTGIVRIFNTYGPRMRPHDGRVVTSFIAQALTGVPLTIYGDGTQTRSFCFVRDLTLGLLAMMNSDDPGPINLGNPTERSMVELAAMVVELTGSKSTVEYHPLPLDDPLRRRPDISCAVERLGWRPVVPIEEGLQRTIEWLRAHPTEVREAIPSLAGGQVGGIVQPHHPAEAPARSSAAAIGAAAALVE